MYKYWFKDENADVDRGDADGHEDMTPRHVASVVDQVVHARAACAFSGGRSGIVRDVALHLTLI